MAKNTDCTLKNLRLSASALAVASCLALASVPLVAHAAGLGKVTVFSALGQPLRAEVELSASREELSGMRAQLASQEAFKQAGLDFPTTLTGIKFAIDKNASGQSIIKLSSDRPINDPFVDMLLELNWPSGRLVREYTFLLDPPEVTARAAAQVTPALSRPVVSAPPKPAAPSKPPAETRAAEPLDDKPPAKPEAAAKPRVQEKAKEPAPAPAPAVDGQQRDVKRGDTLRKIAHETKPEGVSLDQMLVGLFRANPEAFDSGNMNRLKSGKILTIPDKSSLEAVSDGEAKKIIVAQSSDWNAYRRKLAGIAAQTPAKADTGKQESTGKITAKVEDQAAPVAERKDQVKVSRTEVADAKLGAAAKRSEEDLIAKEKALKEANDRLASLEKNVADLQKLVELKNQSLADLQKQAAAKAAAPVEAKKPEPEIKPPAATVSPAVAPAPVKAEPPPPPVTMAAKPAEAPAEVKQEIAKPESKPIPIAEDKPKAKPAAPPPAPPEEPSFVDDLLEDPILLAGGGGILALLAGFLVYKRRRQNAKEKPLTASSTLAPTTDSLVDNSVFRSTGGQSVDTSQTPAQTDFSQAGPGSIDTDEVDPVAEADVYMAYGRDAQAEEILLEAKQKDSKRYAIHLKLLEIYLNRKSLKQFESLATDLYSETGGVGAEWEKAAAMGLKLDPENPLYGGAAETTQKSFDPDATVVVSQQSHSSTIAMAAMAPMTEAVSEPLSPTFPQEAPIAQVAVEEPEPAELMSLDFDLGASDEIAAPSPATHRADLENTVTLPEAGLDDNALDFDLGTPPTAQQIAEQVDETAAALDFNIPEIGITEPAPAPETPSDLDFDLGFDISPEPALAAEPSIDTRTIDLLDIDAPDDGALEFDIQLTESTVLGQPMHESSFDMSSINLDLAEAAPLEPTQSPALDELTDLPPDTSELDIVAPPDFSLGEPEGVVDPEFSADFDSEFGSAQELDITPSEEVATKLDLAKAYEEMGDLEGARELLQEVIKEGDATQREKAQAILAKIGD